MASLQSDLKNKQMQLVGPIPILKLHFWGQFFLLFGPKPQIFVERSKFSVPQNEKMQNFREKERRPKPNKKCHLWHSEKYDFECLLNKVPSGGTMPDTSLILDL